MDVRPLVRGGHLSLVFVDLWDQTSCTVLVLLLSLLPVCIPHPHPPTSESGEHRGRIDSHPLADPLQRSALPVEPDSLVDLMGGEVAPPHRHTMTVQDLAHGSPIDPKPFAQLVHRGTCHVTRDEFLDLLALQLPGRARPPATSRGTRRHRSVRQPPEQRLQLADLVLCVVVTSRQLHHRGLRESCLSGTSRVGWPQ